MTFALRLCLALGITYGALQDSMGVDEFLLWQQFDAEHRLPDARAEILAAQQAQLTLNTAGKAFEGWQPMGDFFPLQPAKPSPPKAADPDAFLRKL